MPKSVALFLRGINVGKHNRISMADLRKILAESGYREAETYLQSGNVRVWTDLSPGEVASRVESALEKGGIKNPVVAALPWERLKELVSLGVFANTNTAEERGLAIFLRELSENAKSLIGRQGGLTIVAAEPDVLFGTVATGQTHAVDFKKLVERPLGTQATVRFCNVVEDWVKKQRP